MTIWPKHTQSINGLSIDTIAPIIISASRSTDIPAFYAQSFINQLKNGFLFWTNPFNGIKIPVSLKQVKLIVFWSKNPSPLIPFLKIIDEMNIDYYFNYTLNDYEIEGFEKKLPALDKRIDTFIELSEKIIKEKVIWRFDPVVLIKNQNQSIMIDKIVAVAEKLHPFTNKLVFSFVDFHYKKVQQKFKKSGIEIQELNTNDKLLFASELSSKLKGFNLEISTCAEALDLSEFGINHNKCIDDELITNIFSNNKTLMDFIESLKANNNLKDKGQRENCGCIPSKDIGKYNTCHYNCTYCYALQSQNPLETIKNIFD